MFICASSARAVTNEAFSPGARVRLVANNITRVRLSELRLYGSVKGNGPRINVTALSAMALSLLSSVASVGGTSVRVASLLVALPKAFVTRQRNFAPLSAAVLNGIDRPVAV